MLLCALVMPTAQRTLCYICGELTFAKEKRSITSYIKKLFKAYFHCDIVDQDKSCFSCLLPYMSEEI